MIEIQAPYPFVTADLFLAGSIEMGATKEWQAAAIDAVRDVPGVVLNPRRKDWDASWVQSKDNVEFRQQVEWELRGLEVAASILFYFDPTTQSPIALMELGLVIDKRLIVICPEGFWRKGNVEILCQRYGHQVYTSLDEGLAAYKQGHTALIESFHTKECEGEGEGGHGTASNE